MRQKILANRIAARGRLRWSVIKNAFSECLAGVGVEYRSKNEIWSCLFKKKIFFLFAVERVATPQQTSIRPRKRFVRDFDCQNEIWSRLFKKKFFPRFAVERVATSRGGCLYGAASAFRTGFLHRRVSGRAASRPAESPASRGIARTDGIPADGARPSGLFRGYSDDRARYQLRDPSNVLRGLSNFCAQKFTRKRFQSRISNVIVRLV